ncbi:hypothetical protein JOB18_032404 [Solea senegalensis]|uniref:Uncharacterized protein n=1 Tax=Solea senegalensis TaxID=28829 RepID=A0AAV6SM57_SOLSE|nr:hypothetical protein JOB18_032404 [Solea senegalensis]
MDVLAFMGRDNDVKAAVSPPDICVAARLPAVRCSRLNTNNPLYLSIRGDPNGRGGRLAGVTFPSLSLSFCHQLSSSNAKLNEESGF